MPNPLVSQRLPQQRNEVIDRRQKIRFSFEGESYDGFSGDTISSALWASGVRVLGRSFKYHRPRGIFSMADVDCNAMMESPAETNIRGDVTPITEDLTVTAVNTMGGVKNDALRILDKFGAFTPVGFYYKAFHTPRRLFPFYENSIRKVAGLGRVNETRSTPPSPKDYAFCDVLVVGAGPSGLAAAFSAAEQGAQVILVDENEYAGGSFRYLHVGDENFAELWGRVQSHPGIATRLGTLAAGYYADHWLALVDKQRMTKLRARSVVVAAGCYEQPAVFRNNDLPGVMLATGALRLMQLYSVRPFAKAIVLTANADGYEAALTFNDAGIEIAAMVDLRPAGEPGSLAAEVAKRKIPIHRGSAVYEAVPGPGKRSIKGAVVCALDAKGAVLPDTGVAIAGDGIAMSVGWTPADGLLRQANTRMVYSADLEQFVPHEFPSGVFAAGRVNGFYDLNHKIEDGRCAGLEAALYLATTKEEKIAPRPEPSGPARSHAYPVFFHPKGKNFIDLDEDVTLKDIENACQEGFDHPELLKRYSTVGMGSSQGKHSNLLALRVLTRWRGEEMRTKEMTTARPFTRAIKLSHLAGRIFTAVRRTPIHSFHEAHRAKFMYAGSWMRPEYYQTDGLSREQCIYREAKNVRHGVGLIDLGTLGKIEACGPDVVEFLHRFYTGFFARLRVGRSRYGAMCDESGVIIDDGIVGRLAEDRFYFSTTTTGSDAIYQLMQRWIIEWGLSVLLTNVTSHYLAMNLAGPHSIEVLQPLTDIDLGGAAFPYLRIREGTVAGVPARLSRVGFVGEFGFEIHLNADGALHAWNALMEAGKPFEILPFGVEAQRILRLEKGHIIIGQDTDGLTQPDEAGMAWAVKMRKPFFFGQRSLVILQKKQRLRELVGFTLPEDYEGPLPKESHLVIENDEIAGRVTSIGLSPAVGRPIGLAYVKPEQNQVGRKINIRIENGAFVEATVAALPFYDPENLRQKPKKTTVA